MKLVFSLSIVALLSSVVLPQTPDREYERNRIKGLKAVVVEVMTKDVDLKTEVELTLRKSGVPILKKSEAHKFRPTEWAVLLVDAITSGESDKGFGVCIRLTLFQMVKGQGIGPNPEEAYELHLWYEARVIPFASNNELDDYKKIFGERCSRMVALFANDWLAVNPKA